MKEEIKVNAELICTLESKSDWIRTFPKYAPDKIRAGETWIWLDKLGNVFELGRDFEAAEKLDSYPCKIYRTVCVNDAFGDSIPQVQEQVTNQS